MNNRKLETGHFSCVDQLMKYIRKGEGEHQAVPTDQVLGLNKVVVSWHRISVESEGDVYKLDDSGDDRTSSYFTVNLCYTNGKTDTMIFHIQFAGF